MRSLSSTLTVTLCAALALTLSACAAEKSDEVTEAATEDSAPAIGSGVAPGVAFTYRYAFELPAKAIARVQETHARACRDLGTARCRVTGIAFEQQGDSDAAASTAFLLAPDLAHSFGTDALGAVEKADGRLASATVNGEDAGGAIRLSQQDSAAIAAEIARIEARLKSPGLSAGERQELSRRTEELRDQNRGEEQVRRTKEAAIASTPVVFDYASESALGTNPFSAAAAASWSSAQGLLGFLLVAAGLLLPWLLPVGLLVLLVRYVRRRRAPGEQPAA